MIKLSGVQSANTLKSWNVSRIANAKSEKALVDVQSRNFGLISRILSYFKIDLVTNFIVYKNRVVYEKGNILGFVRSIIPIRGVTSVHAGRKKPIIEALVIGALMYFILRLFSGGILDFFADTFELKRQTVAPITTWLGLFCSLNAIGLGLIYFLFVNHLYIGIIESGENKYDILIREFPWTKTGSRKKGSNQKLAEDSAAVILRLLQTKK